MGAVQFQQQVVGTKHIQITKTDPNMSGKLSFYHLRRLYKADKAFLNFALNGLITCDVS